MAVIRLTAGRKCINHLCPNKVGEGTWAILMIPNAEPPRPGTRDVVLDMCAGCAEMMERAQYIIKAQAVIRS